MESQEITTYSNIKHVIVVCIVLRQYYLQYSCSIEFVTRQNVLVCLSFVLMLVFEKWVEKVYFKVKEKILLHSITFCVLQICFSVVFIITICLLKVFVRRES